MNFNSIMEVAKDKAIANAPAILNGAGITAIVGGVFLACKATLDLKAVLDEHDEKLKDIKERAKEDKEYNRGRDTRACYTRTCCSLIKLYAPATIAITVGIGCMLGSNAILEKRNAQMAAAVTTINAAYNEYRKRVIEDAGEEKDEEYATGKHKEEIVVEEVDENGKPKKKKKKVDVYDPNAMGRGYLKYITPANPYWIEDPVLMENWIKSEEKYANWMYNIQKRRTLAQIFDRMGLNENTLDPDSLIMGWVKDEFGDGPKIKFNAKECYIPNGDGDLIRVWKLDFNVQGNIHKAIKRRQLKAA